MIVKLYVCEKCGAVSSFGTINAWQGICTQHVGWNLSDTASTTSVICLGKIVPLAQFACEPVRIVPYEQAHQKEKDETVAHTHAAND